MSETKNSTTQKVLRTHDRIMSWSWLLADLLLAALIGVFTAVVVYMILYKAKFEQAFA